MVICNVLLDTIDEKISNLNTKKIINVCTDLTQIDTTVETLVYGYSLAKKLFGKYLNPTTAKINSSYYWSFSTNEKENTTIVDEFIESRVKKYFKCIENGIDVVIKEFDIDIFVDHLTEYPLLHRGKHEIYVVDYRASNQYIIHSFKKDTLEYSGVSPDVFFNAIIDKLHSECIMFSTDEIDLFNDREVLPLFLQDLYLAETNIWLTMKDIEREVMILKNTNTISKADVLIFLVKKLEFIRNRRKEIRLNYV